MQNNQLFVSVRTAKILEVSTRLIEQLNTIDINDPVYNKMYKNENLSKALGQLKNYIEILLHSLEYIEYKLTNNIREEIEHILLEINTSGIINEPDKYQTQIIDYTNFLGTKLITYGFLSNLTKEGFNENSIIRIAQYISENEVQIDKALKSIQEWNKQRTLFTENTLGEHAIHYRTLAKENVGWKSWWSGYNFWLIFALCISGALLYIGKIFYEDLKFQKLDNISLGNAFVRISLFAPLVFFLVFSINQYNYHKKLNISYHHKASTLDTMKTLIHLFAGNEPMQQLIVEKTITTIFAEPRIKDKGMSEYTILSYIDKFHRK